MLDMTRLKARCKQYAITSEQFMAMLYVQNFTCGICNEPIIVEGRGQSAIDHCHVSYKVRGVLCGDCNMLLGRIEEKGFARFVSYLAKPFAIGHRPPPVKRGKAGRPPLPPGQRKTAAERVRAYRERNRLK